MSRTHQGHEGLTVSAYGALHQVTSARHADEHLAVFRAARNQSYVAEVIRQSQESTRVNHKRREQALNFRDRHEPVSDHFAGGGPLLPHHCEHEPLWMAGAMRVVGEWAALEAASADAPYILDAGDLEEAQAWVVVDLPIAAFQAIPPNETPDECEARMQCIRSVPPGELYRPIVEGFKDGALRLLDGWHRLKLAGERGQTHASALVKLDFEPVTEARFERPSRTERPCG